MAIILNHLEGLTVGYLGRFKQSSLPLQSRPVGLLLRKTTPGLSLLRRDTLYRDNEVSQQLFQLIPGWASFREAIGGYIARVPNLEVYPTGFNFVSSRCP